jgi:hypothetical protein
VLGGQGNENLTSFVLLKGRCLCRQKYPLDLSSSGCSFRLSHLSVGSDPKEEKHGMPEISSACRVLFTLLPSSNNLPMNKELAVSAFLA